jgi:type VI secretion system protein ImpG
MDERADFLRYYKSELTYLRQMGRSFAATYPKLAGRLELSADECADPHVERLIESVAFLTARLQRQLDGQFPEITSSLLGVAYPHLVNPIPPMSIAQFFVDPKQGKLTSGRVIPSKTRLFAQTGDGLTCRFQTAYPVTLWPLEVAEARFESRNDYTFLDSLPQAAIVLRLRLMAVGTPFRELGLDRIRVYLKGDSGLVSALYELLFCHVFRIALLGSGRKTPLFLPPSSIQPVGFGLDEDVIPYPSHAHPGYRLLQEYFQFPEKFCFFDLAGLDPRCFDQDMQVLILLDQHPRERLIVDESTFCLGCAPILNLFDKTSEPIRLDQRELEYRLVADIRRERTTEIHSIASVSASSNPAEETAAIEPFYSFRHRMDGQEPHAFWHARRASTGREDLPGTDVLLSFVDLNFNPSLPPQQVVYAHVACTNRELALQIPAGAQLFIEDVAPLERIACLHKPTAPAYSPLAGATLWQLISNLSLNYLSLTDGKAGLEALREILRLYSFSERAYSHQQINGIREMQCRRVTRRVGSEPWRGFCQGAEVDLTFDEDLFEGSGAFLMGAVLRHFLALYASVNSFTQLVIRSTRRDGEWKRWPPLAGVQEVI